MAFADVSDVEDRLDFTLSEAEQRMTLAALEDASVLARGYAGQNWPDHAAPKHVVTIVLNVVARYMRNPDGYTTSRAGDETVTWSDLRGKAALHFTDDEKEELAGYSPWGTVGGIGSIGVYAHRKGSSRLFDEYVPAAGFPSPHWFPLISRDDAWMWRE